MEARSWLPDPIGGTLWFAPHAAHTSVYAPFPCGKLHTHTHTHTHTHSHTHTHTHTHTRVQGSLSGRGEHYLVGSFNCDLTIVGLIRFQHAGMDLLPASYANGSGFSPANNGNYCTNMLRVINFCQFIIMATRCANPTTL